MSDRPETFGINASLDVHAACRGARGFAAELGFSRRACEEVALLVSELATNIVKYGVRGTIAFERVDDPVRGVGIAVVAADAGPPFQDLTTALKDGHNDRGPIDPISIAGRRGFGGGLGAVRRLADLLELESLEVGKRLRAVRYLARSRTG